MRQLTVHEHTFIRRCGAAEIAGPGELEAHLFARLRATDRGDNVFEWSDRGCRTTQWVGVVQAPGLQVEILPKTDAFGPPTEEAPRSVRSNLLYMLALSGQLPVRRRDLARLCTRQASLSEVLVGLFAEQLRDELLRGPERSYEAHEENLRQFKGKLLVSRQALTNAAQRDRFYCRHEDFSLDTRLNRVFKTCCRLLLEGASTPATQDALRQSLLLLQDVSDTDAQIEDLDRITLNRQNERFRELLGFCRLILSGRSPLGQAGATSTFSLLFDMNIVFERFIAAFVQHHVAPNLAGIAVFPQGAQHRIPLLKQQQKDILLLKPDLLVKDNEGRCLLLDTKWKQLSTRSTQGGISNADLYQIFAYIHRYNSQRGVLLYPSLPGVEPKDFDIPKTPGQSARQVLVRTVKLHANLHQEAGRQQLADELKAILQEGLTPTA